MSVIKTDKEYKVVNALNSTLSYESLIDLSKNNNETEFITPFGIILNGVIIADTTPNISSTQATPNTIVGRDSVGDIYVRGIVDDSGLLYAFPRSLEQTRDNADVILQERLENTINIKSINGYSILGYGNLDINVPNKGYFIDLSSLIEAYPQGSLGDIAYVGTSYPYSIYTWDGIEQWYDTGETGGDPSVDVSKFLTAAPFDDSIYNETIGEYLPTTGGTIEGNLKVKDSLIANTITSNQISTKAIIKEGSTNKDVLLGDGSTINLSEIVSDKFSTVDVSDSTVYDDIDI